MLAWAGTLGSLNPSNTLAPPTEGNGGPPSEPSPVALPHRGSLIQSPHIIGTYSMPGVTGGRIGVE
jgi:hypothetical protein